MQLTTTIRRGAACIVAAVICGAAPGVAAADETGSPTQVVLASGGAAVGEADPHTEMSVDGGATWIPATVVQPHPAWGQIDGAQWISSSADGLDRVDQITSFRRSFELPSERIAGTVRVCLFVDNAVTVRLNDRVLGETEKRDTFVHYSGQPLCWERTGRLVEGHNVLEFEVHDLGDIMGLDYRVDLTYAPAANVPPVVRLPASFTTTTADPADKPLFYWAEVSDDGFEPPTMSCDPPSGSLVPNGTTTVTCVATDDEGASTTASFTVTRTYVNRPPVLRLPGPVVVEATGASGAVVTYEVRTADYGAVELVCTPSSGSVFPVGTTTVQCTATDDEGATTSGSFDVTVTYTNLPPVLAQPADVVVDATGPSGASVDFDTPAATDDGPAQATVACDPAPGSAFAIGSTEVTCVATDDEGLQSAPATFTVTVRGADDQLADLLASVTGVGPGTSLADKVAGISAAVAAGDLDDACGTLGALLNQVSAQTGEKLPVDVAAAITEDATRIRAVLGC